MPAGRKPKITPELQDKIVEVLEQTGSDRLAYEAANISSATFYRELSRNREFSEAVDRARQNRTQLSHTLTFNRVQAAHDYIDQVLQGNKYKITRQTTTDPQGNKTITIKEEQIVPDSKMLDRVLGQMQSDVKLEVQFGLAEPDDDAD